MEILIYNNPKTFIYIHININLTVIHYILLKPK
jgi:hypothetical protein